MTNVPTVSRVTGAIVTSVSPTTPTLAPSDRDSGGLRRRREPLISVRYRPEPVSTTNRTGSGFFAVSIDHLRLDHRSAIHHFERENISRSGVDKGLRIVQQQTTGRRVDLDHPTREEIGTEKAVDVAARHGGQPNPDVVNHQRHMDQLDPVAADADVISDENPGRARPHAAGEAGLAHLETQSGGQVAFGDGALVGP